MSILLDNPAQNRDTAFTVEQRQHHKLLGRLPLRVETLEEQVARHYHQYQQFASDLQKSVYLNELYQRNQVLFYRLVAAHMVEMLPIVYTPTVGDLVMQFSQQLRRPYGLYLSYPEREQMAAAIAQLEGKLDLLVATDGSAVLGIGDQGVGAMAISIGKLMVYSAVGGINPNLVLPVVLDVGTDNETLLNDPMYLGWRHERIKGAEYDEFIDKFVTLIRAKYPKILLHWEDFSKETSLQILNRYRPGQFTFNDDIQGTGGVTVACILTALRKLKSKLSEQRIVFHGAGSSAVGIAEQLVAAMEAEGVTQEEARQRIWLLNSKGLVTTKSARLSQFQQPFARKDSEQNLNLHEVVTAVHPTILIGCSTVAGAFSEEIVKEMAAHTTYPLILPLSNPSSKTEALPEDLVRWTEGRAMIATGSPFPEVKYGGKTIPVAQCNNALIFPALGLGALAAQANRVTDGMIRAASNYLSEHMAKKTGIIPLLPNLDEYPALSKKIALAVAEQARKEGVAEIANDADLEQAIANYFWIPEY